MDPLYINIEKDTIDNPYYRKVIHTTPYNQVVLMSLEPGEDIPKEVHSKLTQFIRVEQGTGKAIIEGKEYILKDGISLNILPGSRHYIVPTGNSPLKLYTIYSPAEHPDGLIQTRQKDYTEQIPADVLRLTYGYLDDADLARACLVSKNFNTKLCNSKVWIRKIMEKFPFTLEQIDRFKGHNTYGAYYLNLLNYENTDDLLETGIENNRADLVVLALRRGANPNEYTFEGILPLRDASSKGNAEIVEILLQAGADVNIDRNNSPILKAAEKGHLDVVKLLLSYGADIKSGWPLISASGAGYSDVVKVLLDAGANVHAQDDWPLKLASMHGRLDVVKVLLDAGANVHAGDDSALGNAITHNHLDVVKVLLDAGANVHAGNDWALNYAVRNNKTDVINLLEEYM